MIQSAATLLDTIAFRALLLLGVVVACEQVQPLLRLANRLDITNIEALLLMILAAWLGAHLLRRTLPTRPPRLTRAMALWFLVLGSAALLAPAHRAEAIKFVLRLGNGMLIGWAAYDLAYTPARWQQLGRALALGGILVGGVGLLEATGWPPVTAWLGQFKAGPTLVGDLLRVSATLSYATIAAMVLEMTIPLTLAWLLTIGHPHHAALLALALLAQLSALLLTLTRAGIAALGVALGVMALLAWRHHHPQATRASLATAASLAALIALLMILHPRAGLRLRSETDQAWYRAHYQAPATLQSQPGTTTTIPIHLTNTSVRPWHTTGPHPMGLTYHLLRADGTPLITEGAHISLPHDIPPQSSVTLQVSFLAPTTPGPYLIEWDMIQQGITWFSKRGTPPSRTALTVLGVSAPQPTPNPPPPPQAVVPAPGRLTLWRTALAMIQAHPLLGVGPDNFRLLYGTFANVAWWNPRIHTNNLYLEWLTNTGILGLIAYLWLHGRLLVEIGDRLRQEPTPHARAWRLAILASLTAWFGHGLFDYFYAFTPTALLFWLLVALGLNPAPPCALEKQPSQ